jgi:hypothetical protein
MVKQSVYNRFKLVTSIIIVCCLLSCGLFSSKDESFSFPRTPYNGNEFRIDGYYYETVTSSSNNMPVILSRILFFYRNGIVMSGGLPSLSELPETEESFRNGQYYATYKGDQLYWGIFKIDGTIITRERWSNPNGTYLAYRYYAEILNQCGKENQRKNEFCNYLRYYAEILNDTTIRFTASEHVDGKDHKALDNTYHFKQFSPKPDSVVSFIP